MSKILNNIFTIFGSPVILCAPFVLTTLGSGPQTCLQKIFQYISIPFFIVGIPFAVIFFYGQKYKESNPIK